MAHVTYDVCVVGAGMFGCAAARYASETADTKVCLIGPDEPKTKEEFQERDIYSSHYDEGRIFQTGSPNPVRRALAKQSFDKFKQLEEKSGVPFYTCVGFFHAFKKTQVEESLAIDEILKEGRIKDITSTEFLKNRYPFLSIDDGEYRIVFESENAGHLNPRKMIEAQKAVCLRHGCRIIQDVVSKVSELRDGVHKIVTERNGVVQAKRVIICAGAFTNFKELLPRKICMDVTKEIAAMIKISKEEAERLKSMSSGLIQDGYSTIASTVNGYYILPPILYPDTFYYIKAGHSGCLDYPAMASLQETKDWFNGSGDKEYVDFLTKKVMELIPDLKVEEVKAKVCITCYSPTDIPYIDTVSPTVTVAAVGNGIGATICEEVGRLAALLALGEKWDSNLPRSVFKVIWKN